MKWLVTMTGGVVTLGALYGALAWSANPAADQGFFKNHQGRPLVMAHRGGAGLWPENTVHAFTQAAALGVDVLETDLHATADGALVLIHDGTVDRTTNGAGRVNELTLAELKRLDAGHRWSPDGGRSFPLRGRGITVPTLQEVFDRFPGFRFNIDIKQQRPSLAQPLCKMIRDAGIAGKVMVGSFHPRSLEEFRKECADVPTSASPAEVSAFLAASTNRLKTTPSFAARALQVPEYAGGRRVLTRSFIEAAHARNLDVHAWTVNEAEDMKRLLDLGVDGIITDYPDRLIALLDHRR